MKAKLTAQRAVSAGTKLPPEMNKEAKRVAENAGIRMSDLLRIGLTRLLADVRKNKGVLILGKDK